MFLSYIGCTVYVVKENFSDSILPLVSIIIPTFKHAELLAETLDSVFAQDFKDYEVVVVNDGSPDNTASILSALVETSQIRYVEQSNAGQAAARNVGISMATGEFIALLDDDDLIPRDKLKWQVEMLRGSTDVELVGGMETRSMKRIDVTTEVGPRRRISGIDVFWGCPFTSPGQTLIRASAIRDVGGFDPDIRGVDDFDLYVKLARRRPLLLIDRIALQYREHLANASKNRKDMLEAGRICLRRRLPEVPWRQRWAASRRAYRGLYEMAGREVLRGSLEGPGWDKSRVFECLRAIWPGLKVDPKLAKRVFADLICR